MAPDALSQDGHVVVPYQWLVSFGGAQPIAATDEAINSQPLSNQTWIMRVANPNATPDAYANDNIENEILITPLQDTWSFQRDAATWTGSQGSGGRIFCAPFNLLSFEEAMIGDFILGLLEGFAVVIFSSNGQTEQITDEAGRTYFSYAALTPGGVSAPATTTGAVTRRINTNQKTRIPDLTFVPTYHSTARMPVRLVAPPFEMYFIRRPARGYRWPGTHAAGATALSVTIPKSIPTQLLHPNPQSPKLTFDLRVDRRLPYRWNLNCPRMSVDIASTTAADAVDRVTKVDTGSGSQTIELLTDAKAGARKFAITVAGWRGNYGSRTKVYTLNDIALEAGTSLVAGMNDGGKELWVHNPGNAITFTLELYAGAVSQPVVTRSNVMLEPKRIFRITPSDWEAAKMSNAVVYLDVFDATTGHLVKQVQL
jgi:hypothetical protein